MTVIILMAGMENGKFLCQLAECLFTSLVRQSPKVFFLITTAYGAVMVLGPPFFCLAFRTVGKGMFLLHHVAEFYLFNIRGFPAISKNNWISRYWIASAGILGKCLGSLKNAWSIRHYAKCLDIFTKCLIFQAVYKMSKRFAKWHDIIQNPRQFV